MHRVIGMVAGIPTLLGASGVVGYLIGRWIDDRFGTNPWFQLLFFGLGMAAGIRESRRLLKRVERDMEEL